MILPYIYSIELQQISEREETQKLPIGPQHFTRIDDIRLNCWAGITTLTEHNAHA